MLDENDIDFDFETLKRNDKLPDKDILIDEIDMEFVQLLITAVNESKLDQIYKETLRKTLDRWQNALTLTNKIWVTF